MAQFFLQEMEKKTKSFLVFEMNMGQMIKDVQLAVAGKAEVRAGQPIVIVGADKAEEAIEVLRSNWVHTFGKEIYSL